MLDVKRMFYGWKIVGASIIILAVGLGMFTSTNSVFVKPICDALGFSRSQFTFYRTVITLASAFVMPLYGKIIQRIGVKKMLFTGALMLSLVTIGYSFVNSIWHFYALALINGVFFNAISFMVIGLLVSCWFNSKKGFATGLAFSGSGLGAAIMIPVISRVIELAGWRFAYVFMGILGLAILIPTIIFFIKETPEKMGLKAYYVSKAKSAENNSANGSLVDLSFKESFATKRFWLLLIAVSFISVFASATNTHSAPYLSDIGYPASMVSAVISLFMFLMTVGKIILGVVYDRFGSMAGNLIISAGCIIFPVAALLSHIPAFTWVYAVSVGMASCGLSVTASILIAKYFGMKDYPAIFSLFTMISTLSSSISVPAMGAVYDYSGSYRPAWFALLGFSVIIVVCLVSAELSYRKKDLHN